MFWSVNIGSIAGTAIRIHFTFLLFLAWIFAAGYITGGSAAAWNGLIFLILLFACVLAHEFGHIFTARAFGVATPDVTLLPIGGVARLERLPEKPSEEFLIAIAGPAVNVVIAFALVAFAGANLSLAGLGGIENTAIPMVNRLAVVNLFIAAFNVLPAFPMDGGRILRATLAARLGYTRATEIAASIGQAFAFLLGFIGLFANPMLIFIAIFIYLAAASEAQLVAVRAMSRGVPVTSAMMTQFATLSPEARIEEAIDTLLRTSQSEFPVVDGMRKPVGLLDRKGLIQAVRQLGPDARVDQAMVADIVTIGNRRCLEDAFRLLQEKQTPAVTVVDPTGRLVGMITSETIGEMLMVRDALPERFRFGPWSRTAGA